MRVNHKSILAQRPISYAIFQIVCLYSRTFRLKVINEQQWHRHLEKGGKVLLCTWPLLYLFGLYGENLQLLLLKMKRSLHHRHSFHRFWMYCMPLTKSSLLPGSAFFRQQMPSCKAAGVDSNVAVLELST